MATTVFTREEIELTDGKVVTIAPLVIKRRRQLMQKVSKWSSLSLGEFLPEGVNEEDENYDSVVEEALMKLDDAAITGLVDMALFCLGSQGEYLAELDEDGDKLALSVLEMDTVYKIIDVCGGVNLRMDDPKVLEQMSQG